MRNLLAPLRFLIVCLILSACCIGTSVSADEFRGKKVLTAKPKKGITGKQLDSQLKSDSEESWERGLSKVTASSLDNDAIVEAVCKFANRESNANRLTPSLVRSITLLAEAKQPRAVEQLGLLLDSENFGVVMAAADIISMAQDRGFLDSLMKLAERREFAERYGFRRCVMDAVARYRNKESVDFLVEKIGRTDGQLKYEIATNLQQTTGQNFGGKAADWQDWWKSHREDFVFAARAPKPESAVLKTPPRSIPWDEPRPSFYGMTIYAKRVVFVIDRSGSMNTAINEETRLQKAQQELHKAIKALLPTDFFNIVAFDDRMEVFSPRLVTASEENKSEGVRFAYGLEPRGGTACYEPLKMALEASKELELILFLSDGEPTAGALIDPSAIVLAISNQNLTQRTTLHTLGIDARGQHESFLKNLAEKNMGKLLLVR